MLHLCDLGTCAKLWDAIQLYHSILCDVILWQFLFNIPRRFNRQLNQESDMDWIGNFLKIYGIITMVGFNYVLFHFANKFW